MGDGVGGRCRIPAEAHISVPCHRHIPINRSAGGVVGVGRRRVPAERHAPVIAQRDGAGRVPINRAAAGVGRAGRILNIRKMHALIILVIHRAGPAGGDSHSRLHSLTVADEPEDSIFAQLQNGICPEPGAGLGGIEVVGDGIIRRIQGDGITCSIYQPGNAGEEGVGLAIAGSGEGE